jgi:hypothetical protein
MLINLQLFPMPAINITTDAPAISLAAELKVHLRDGHE